MQSLTQPTLLLKPFAESGNKNSLPVTNTDASNPQLADLTNGFPPITSEDPEDTGLPPEREDFNGLGDLTTTHDYFYQAGGTFTFNSTISTAIGGYPLNARLWYTDGNGGTVVLRSTKGNNTDNFVTTPSYIGTSWVAETPSLTWNNAWTGTNTFTTQSVSDDSTKVATTAYVKDCVPVSVGSPSKPVYTNANGVVTACDFGLPNYQYADTTGLGNITNGASFTPTQNGTLHLRANGAYAKAGINVIKGDGELQLAYSEQSDSGSVTQLVWVIVRAGETYKMYGTGTLWAYFCPFG